MRGVPGSGGRSPTRRASSTARRGCRRPAHDRLELVGVVVVEPGDEPEPVAQRARDHAGARRRADQRERRQRQADARGRRALADDDVELEVLHRRVQDLLDGPREAVDLVDEQHVALLQLGEDGRQVAGPLESRAGRDVQVHAHLGGDDAGQRRLAEPRRAGEQQVVGGLPAPAGRLDARCRGAPSARAGRRTRRGGGAQPGLDDVLGIVGDAGIEELLTHGGPPAAAARRGAAWARPPPGQLAQHVADLLGAVAEAGQRLADVADGGAAAPDRRPGSSTGQREPVLELDRAAARRSSCRHPARASARRCRRRRRCRRARSAGGWRGSPSPAPDRRRGWRSASGTWRARHAWRSRTASAPSSRMWWCTWRKTVVVGSSSASVRGETVDEVADAGDLQQHRAVVAAFEHHAAQRADHAAPPRRPRRRARSGAIARWHRASAAASAASGGCGGPVSRSRACTIFCTCSLAAPPQPATASLTWFGRVLRDLAAGGRGLRQRQPAGLADAHRRAHVDLEEHVLHGDGRGAVLGDQRGQLGAQRSQPLRQHVAGRRADDAERHGSRPRRRARRPRRSRNG